MVDIIRECRKIVASFRTKLSRLATPRVDREDIKRELTGIVDGYFRTDRPILLHRMRDESLFAGIDAGMRTLLGYTHRRTLTARYISQLQLLEREWANLEVSTISRFGDKTGGEVPSLFEQEQLIVQTLQAIHSRAANCYKQAIFDLADDNRLSWAGTAAELREALREVLDKLAPDAEVEATPGFRLEGTAKRPTMKQKVRFILKARLQSENARKPVENAAEIVEEKFGSFVRSVYDESSRGTHSEVDRKNVLSVKRFVETVLIELLELST